MSMTATPHRNKFNPDKGHFYLVVRDWTRNSISGPTLGRSVSDVYVEQKEKRIVPSCASVLRLKNSAESITDLCEEALEKFEDGPLPDGYLLARVHLAEKPSLGTDEFGKPYKTIAGVEWFDEPRWPGSVNDEVRAP